MPRTIRLLIIVVIAACLHPRLQAAVVNSSTWHYSSSVSATGSGDPLDLVTLLDYDTTMVNAPIMVLMHGYSTGGGNSIASYYQQAQRLRDAGFFVLTVAMRGRDGSQGVRDSGGVEIHDIYDAVEAVKTQFAGIVNPTSVSITGYSGGGGNVMSALTKFPDYFRVGAAFFGMSDYGYDAAHSWYADGASTSHQAQMNTDVGNPLTGGDAVTDRYLARASNLGSKNNPYSEIHLFVNADEEVCKPVQSTSYRDNAVASATYDGEFDNVTVHIGQAGTYHDFDGDGTNDANEQQYWPHGKPTANQQAAAEQWYLTRLLSGEIAQPTLNDQDQLLVLGYVKTSKFSLWLGDGQNAAGDLDYSLSDEEMTFDLALASNDASVTGVLQVDTSRLGDRPVNVLLNGEQVDSFSGGGLYTFTGLGDQDSLVFSAVPEPGMIVMLISAGVSGGLLAWRRSARSRRPTA